MEYSPGIPKKKKIKLINARYRRPTSGAKFFVTFYVKIIFMYDLIILGGGPAGASAAVYAARKQLKTAIITSLFEGQSVFQKKFTTG